MKVEKKYGFLIMLMILVMAFNANAQDIPVHRCGTMELLKIALEKAPTLADSFNKEVVRIQQVAASRITAPGGREFASTVFIPVVFHVVLGDPKIVSDQQLIDQINVMNADYAGLNADSVVIPAAFKALFGKSRIQFVLAKRTPDNQPSNGIERFTTAQSYFDYNNTAIKYTASGGADAWDATRFFNIWVCELTSGLLGYSTMPRMAPNKEQGIVISFRTLPGGSLTGYNKGRTVTHETGHFFFLYHIWGDDQGACTGTDYVDDTPNQGDATSGCPGGIVTDACTTTAPGILYQDYMDYSSDGCMAMFTKQQVARMESALTTYRSTLITSNGGTSPLATLDAELRSINSPYLRSCSTDINPVVTLRNWGIEKLSSVYINASVDNGTPVQTRWTGSLNSTDSIRVVLNTVSVISTGSHSLKIWVSRPNDSTDMKASNDTVRTTLTYQLPASLPVTEGFEQETFPPANWDILNPDASYTWEKVTGIAKSGNASLVINNYSYTAIGQRDLIRLPVVNISNADSAFLSFQVAAATQTATGALFGTWDTLQVLASTDCGNTWASLYKKWGNSLITHSSPVTQPFVPAANEWRKDSVDLTAYINKGPLLLAFANSTGNQNNVYIDDINLYKEVFNPRLKEKGVLITPNPARDKITVQFYTAPANLKSIALYSSTGQKLAEHVVSSNTSVMDTYNFNLSGYSSGVYVVRIVYSDHTSTQKIIRL